MLTFSHQETLILCLLSLFYAPLLECLKYIIWLDGFPRVLITTPLKCAWFITNHRHSSFLLLVFSSNYWHAASSCRIKKIKKKKKKKKKKKTFVVVLIGKSRHILTRSVCKCLLASFWMQLNNTIFFPRCKSPRLLRLVLGSDMPKHRMMTSFIKNDRLWEHWRCYKNRNTTNSNGGYRAKSNEPDEERGPNICVSCI